MTTNCVPCPSCTVAEDGVMATETKLAEVTFKEAVPVLPFRLAVMLEVPLVTPRARPEDAIVATLVEADAQVTWEVTSRVVESV